MRQTLNSPIISQAPSLEQFLVDEQRRFSDIPAAALSILRAVALTSKVIHKAVRGESPGDVTNSPGTFNASGDKQHKLDILAHNSFVSALETTGEVCALISEEAEDIITLSSEPSKYVVALDPLDGSPNVDVNAPVGTIFSVYQRTSLPGAPIQPTDVLQPGNRQIVAGYVLYGTSTMFVYTAGHGVHGFTYKPHLDDFFLTHLTMKLPPNGKTYAINDSYFDASPNYVQHYIQHGRSNGFAARYTGALVADFHRHLIQGGIYLYPTTKKNPAGKLRLMFEGNALALVAEQAGGAATDGQQSILAIQPSTIHQHTPLYIGSSAMIKDLLAFNVSQFKS